MKASSRAFCSAAETKRNTVVSAGNKQDLLFDQLRFEFFHFMAWLHLQNDGLTKE